MDLLAQEKRGVNVWENFETDGDGEHESMTSSQRDVVEEYEEIENALEDKEDDIFGRMETIEHDQELSSRKLTAHIDDRTKRIQDLARVEHEKALEKQRVNARNLLNRVMKTPFEKNKKIIMLKAFMKWHKVLPLHQKCDELAKIAQDRIISVAAIRDSYLRDIVRIKQHLQKIQEYRDPGQEDDEVGKYAKETGHDMYDLHVVPSLSLKLLVDRALDAIKDPGPKNEAAASQQLQDTLIQSGLANPQTGLAYNAWERSKQYRRIEKNRTGGKFEFPRTQGESIPLAVPQTHELYVKYCKECIGVTQFVRKWNDQVETSLGLTAEGEKMEKEIQRLKKTIEDLNEFISNQERRVLKAEEAYQQLAEGSQFMTEWSYQQEMKDREVGLVQEKRRMTEGVGMVMEDMEGRKQRQNEATDRQNRDWQLKNALLRNEVTELSEALKEENALRIGMFERLTSSEREVNDRGDRIERLEAQSADQKAVIENLREQLAKKTQEHRDVSEKLGDTEAKLNLLNENSSAEILELSKVVTSQRSEIDKKTKEIDKVYDDIREVRSEADDLRGELLPLKEADRVRQQAEALEAARLARKPKTSLKAVAIAVIMCIRIKHALNERHERLQRSVEQQLEHHEAEPDVHLHPDDHGKLGHLHDWGKRVWISDLKKRIEYTEGLLASERAKSAKLTDDLASMTASDNKKAYRIKTLMDTVANEKKRGGKLANELELQRQEVLKLESHIRGLDERDLGRLAKLGEANRVVQCLDTAIHLQREHVRRYALALRRITATLVGMNPDLLSSEWSVSASQDVSNALSKQPDNGSSKGSKKDDKSSKEASSQQLKKQLAMDAARDRKQAGEVSFTPDPSSPLTGDGPAGRVEPLASRKDLEQMSDERRKEVKDLMYNSFTNVVSYFKRWRARLPCAGDAPFRTSMKPQLMLLPLEEETQNFLDKYKNLGKEYLALFRVEGLQVLEQCDEGLTLAKKADSFAKNERVLAWQNLSTITELEQKTADLKAEVKAWEKSEKKRLRTEKKKAEKESAKKEKRRQALESSKKRRAGFSLKTVTAANLSQLPGYEASPQNRQEGSAIEDGSGSAGNSAVQGAGSVEGGAPLDPPLERLSSQDSSTPLQVSVPSVPPPRRSSMETGSPMKSPDKGGSVNSPDESLMPQASTLVGTLALASQAAVSSAEASRKREEVSLSFLDDAPAPAANGVVKVSMFDSIAVSDEDGEEDTGEQEEEISENSGNGSSIHTDTTVDSESSSEDEEDDEDDEEIMELMANLEDLTAEVETLKEERAKDEARIVELEGCVEEKEEQLESLHEKYRGAQVDYEAAISRIKMLRHAVEDNYRERQAEIKRLKQEVDARDDRRERRRLAKQRHASTNIVCSVCAIRAFNSTGEGRGTGASAQFAVVQDHNECDSLSSRSGANKEPLPQESEDLVLTAKPRNINAHKVQTDSARERRRQAKLLEEMRQYEEKVAGLQWEQDPHPFWDQSKSKAIEVVTAARASPASPDAAPPSGLGDELLTDTGSRRQQNALKGEGASRGKDSKFRALNRIPGSGSKKDRSIENRDQERLQEELHRALSGMMRGKQSRGATERMAHTQAAATAQRQQLEKAKRARPKSSGPGMRRSEPSETQPALSKRALQPVGLASRRSLSASSAIGHSNEGGLAWMSATTLRQGDQIIEVGRNGAGFEPGPLRWTLYDGESFQLEGGDDEGERDGLEVE